MRVSNVLAVIAALTVSISAMPSVASTEDACPLFCTKNSDCFGCDQESCVSSLRFGFNYMTHKCDSTSFFALVSDHVVVYGRWHA